MFQRVIATITLAVMVLTLGTATAIILALILTKSARSQPAIPPSAGEVALGNKLMGEIQAGLSCEAAKITMQRRLDEMEKRLRDAEAKAPPEQK